jgi:hypothetical protein
MFWFTAAQCIHNLPAMLRIAMQAGWLYVFMKQRSGNHFSYALLFWQDYLVAGLFFLMFCFTTESFTGRIIFLMHYIWKV